ncbi:MAG: phosphatase PAP2 family protein [Firmicutes bacterium]|nr:phosphatase PAP2 family protein [Bacillota bacterium]
MESINLLISEWIQSFRSDFLDAFFLFITEFGDETVFLIIAAILYWTFDKRFAYRLVMFFLYGAVINGGLKFLTNSPRPHVEFPDRIELVGEGSGGTSLPSGHAQNSTILGLTLNEKTNQIGSWLSRFLFVMVGLVMLSRLYLGEHYLSDVIFGLAIAYAYYTLVNQIQVKGQNPSWLKWVPMLLLIPIALITNDKNIYLASASIVGFTIGFPLELKHIGFSVKGLWWQQILKVILGLVIALAIRVGLKALFEMGLYSADFENNPMFPDQLLDFTRYFIIALWMTLGAPLLFKLLLKPRIK